MIFQKSNVSVIRVINNLLLNTRNCHKKGSKESEIVVQRRRHAVVPFHRRSVIIDDGVTTCMYVRQVESLTVYPFSMISESSWGLEQC